MKPYRDQILVISSTRNFRLGHDMVSIFKNSAKELYIKKLQKIDDFMEKKLSPQFFQNIVFLQSEFNIKIVNVFSKTVG